MKNFWKVTLKNTFTKRLFISVFFWVVLGLVAKSIPDLIHHNTESIKLSLTAAVALVVIIYTIKYIVECIKYFTASSEVNANKHRQQFIMNMSYVAYVILFILMLVFLKMKLLLLFLIVCLIAVILKIVLFVMRH